MRKIKQLLPRRLKRYVLVNFLGVNTRLVTPAREWLECVVLPSLPGLGYRRILFVGTAPYTWSYEAIVRNHGGRWITCDVNPAAGVWGAKEHIVGDIAEVGRRFPTASFDAVILNGVFGFGTDDPAGRRAAIAGAERLLRPDGLLLLGWDADVIADPLWEMKGSFNGFHAAEQLHLPSRSTFADEQFVYDFLYRTAAAT